LKAPVLCAAAGFGEAEDLLEPEAVLLSFHDDHDVGHWRTGPPGLRIPTESGPDFGRTDAPYELVLYSLLTEDDKPYRDEVSVHADLQRTPWRGRMDDDDVDALDVQLTSTPCHYVSADDEGANGLDPGSIYELVEGRLVEVITPRMLGLAEDADLDAFEFCWMELPPVYPGLEGELAFAVLFSTGENKIPAPLSSGGADPTSLHYSFLDGRYFTEVRGDRWNQANIDAIGVVPWNLLGPAPELKPFPFEKGPFYDGTDDLESILTPPD
jgi:hypothetical protein